MVIVTAFKRMFTGKKSRKYPFDITPRQIIKASEKDLKSQDERLSHLPRELYFSMIKISKNLTSNQKLELAERIDELFLNLPNTSCHE